MANETTYLFNVNDYIYFPSVVCNVKRFYLTEMHFVFWIEVDSDWIMCLVMHSNGEFTLGKLIFFLLLLVA
jgi:hypothetical protein